MDFWKIILSILVIFILIVPGYALRKAKLIEGQPAVSALVAIILYVGQPFLTLKSFVLADIADPLNPQLLINMAWALGLAFAGIVAVFGIAKLVFLKYPDKNKAGVYTFASVFSNCGFLGIPFIEILMSGNPYKSYAVIYAIVFNVAFNMLTWTLGVYLLTGNIKAIKIHKTVINPSNIALVIALPMFFIPQINILNTEPIKNVLVFLSGLNAPLSMIIVGIRMADIPIKQIFTGWGTYLAALLKLIAAPLIMLALILPLKALHVLPEDETAKYLFMALIILAALPSAAATVTFSEKFNADSHTASKAFVAVTLLSVLTLLPIIYLAYTYL